MPKKRQKRTVPCDHCQKAILRSPSRIKLQNKHYCSRTCQSLDKTIDITGQTFGYLLVKRMVKNTRDKSGAWVECDCLLCGKKNHIVGSGAIRIGGTKSCGCFAKNKEPIAGEDHACFTGYKKISGSKWLEIRKCAQKRNIEFKINIEDAWGLFQEQGEKCAISGVAIGFSRITKSREGTASIDRIDSRKGYLIDNIQWVHKDVNLMKNTHSMDSFINICRLISKKSRECKS